ncbi:hypothetical protein K502DRAFT_353530 [Neoconidiobolus thromboides FSU 785]|nr:hypothetical protein K502DRAFT_353530 [Neoconidiobolus thromboides FSU 785]
MRVLSAYEETEVLNEVKKRAREYCFKEIEQFVDCARGRTFSVVWTCRKEFNIMNSCTEKFTKPNAVDAVRIEYIKNKMNAKKEQS